MPKRSRNTNVDSGSKIDVQTVLKFSADAIGAIRTSLGPSGGIGTSSMCRDLRGSLSTESRPSNISTSSLRTTAARMTSGSGVPAMAVGVASGSSATSSRRVRASFIERRLPAGSKAA